MSESGTRLQGPSILVVDDSEDNRFTLLRRLKKDGYDSVVAAEDGAQALAALETDHFDLVLLDIMMPEMSGYEVLEQIKSDPDRRDIPVIMISAIDDIDSVIKCIELGAEDYLPKPFNPTLLRARVSSCLEKKRLRDNENAYTARLETDRRQSDSLLHAVLPTGAVNELKTTGSVRPRRHDHVAVLFCDLVGFTAYCDANPPEQVVENLHAVIGRFEEIAQQAGMEKIKTIGDALMATAGLMTHSADPVLSAVRCGLGLIDVGGSFDPAWRISVGIHVGPVVAGIVGNQPYQFDIWGDTVNVAARICDQAGEGQVLLSNDAWMEVRGLIRGKSMGLVDLKGKGAVELVQCTGLKAAAE